MTVEARRTEQTVAVVIAAYNAAATIDVAIRSALSQDEASEIWVVDDASVDETASVAQACEDGSGRLRIIQRAFNGGPSVARNVALSRTRADWICVLDADDRFKPGRLAKLLTVSDGVDMVADAVTRVSSLTEDVPIEKAEAGAAPWSILTLAQFVEGNVSRPGRHREEMGFIKPLLSTAFLRRHGLSYAPELRLGEDFLLYARMLAYGGRLRLGPACGYLALTRADSLSGRHTIDDLAHLRDCTAGLQRIRPLSHAERRAVRRHWRSVDDRLQWRRLIEAVKARDVRAALRTFHDPASALNLVANLTEQAVKRGRQRLGSLPGNDR